MSKASVWLGFTVLWAGYALVFTGYCWVRGYNIGFREIVSPVNWYQGTWPPGKDIPAGALFPSSKTPPVNVPSQA